MSRSCWRRKRGKRASYSGPHALVSTNDSKSVHESEYEEEMVDNEEDFVVNSDGKAITYYLNNSQETKVYKKHGLGNFKGNTS